MRTLISFGQKEAYKRVEQLGDRLAEIKSLMDWGAFLSARSWAICTITGANEAVGQT
jgi:hypothetical protein